ncbi:MAG: TonB-dependent receptor [Flavobacteriales bacterium]|nr:TonB-dependent receptor [Flavobacteriales bacterium]MCB9448202.1 TonB-dependent receptor [Flavobacteriales bacterium]
MKKILFILLCFPYLTTQAQDYQQTIRGTVVDRDSELPIIGANVIIMDSDPIMGSATDADGKFKIEQVPVGRVTLIVRYLGYEEQIIPNVLVTSGKQTVLQIKMVESVVKLETVTIQADQQTQGEVANEMATLSARPFSVEETKRYAGSFDDPARMALSFAGVTSNDDIMNELVVRGNSPRGVLWRLEGIEIPNPNHFGDVGSSGGGISMLSSHMMSNSDFFTGAFPAEFGNATSAVFDMNLRKGNSETGEYAVQAGILGTDIAAEGPFKKGYSGSYLANYRYSTLALMNIIGIKIVGDAAPDFQDLSYNVLLPTKKAGTFSVFGLGGINGIEENWEGDSSKFENHVRNHMGVTGITHKFWLNDKSFIRSVVATSVTSFNYRENQLDTNGNFLHETDHNSHVSTDLRGSVLWNMKANARHTFRVGVNANRMAYQLASSYYNEDTDAKVVTLDTKGHTYTIQPYAAWNYRINEKLTLNSGIHYTRLTLNNRDALEPRIGLKWQINNLQSLSAAFGLHSHVEDASVYQAQRTLPNGKVVFPNKDLGFLKARHYVVAYSRRLAEKLNLKTELYYQELYNVPVPNYPNTPYSAINSSDGYTTDSLINKGTGRNNGVELTLERYYDDGYYFLVTGSLYESKYTSLDNVERNTVFNSNFATNWLGGKEWKVGKNNKKNTIGLSGKVVWSGGRRQTPILLEESIQAGHTVYDETNIYGKRAPSYYRIDMQLLYRKNRPKTTSTWKLDIQNVTNHENIYDYFFDRHTNSIRTSYQLGLLPVLSYKFEF